MIQLQLTNEQMESLLEMVYLGEMVINGHKVEDLEKYTKVQELLFTEAAKAGLNCSDAELPELPSLEFEEGKVSELMEEYDEHTFWEELIKRLTEIKMMETHTPEQISELTEEEQTDIFFSNENEVMNILQEEGLARFLVK